MQMNGIVSSRSIAQEKMAVLKERLASFDQQEDIEEIQEKLTIISQAILGYFHNELEVSQKNEDKIFSLRCSL